MLHSGIPTSSLENRWIFFIYSFMSILRSYKYDSAYTIIGFGAVSELNLRSWLFLLLFYMSFCCVCNFHLKFVCEIEFFYYEV